MKLPMVIETKISQFMNYLNLNIGCIDMILDKENKYYFLEVNPVGQFDQESHQCNYNLYKVIADELTNMYYDKK